MAYFACSEAAKTGTDKTTRLSIAQGKVNPTYVSTVTGQTITNAVTGIGSKLEFVEEKTNSTKNKIVNGLVNVKNQVFSIFGR